MFIVIFGRDTTVLFKGDYRAGLSYGHVEAQCNTLEEAKATRKTLGDLVFDSETRSIVKDDSWLFPTDEYARRCIERNYVLADSFWNTSAKKAA